jgi:hypothetical protein
LRQVDFGDYELALRDIRLKSDFRG